MAPRPHQHHNLRKVDPIRIISITALHALILGHILLSSELISIFGDTARFTVSLILALSLSYFVGVACLQLRLVELITFVSILLVLVVYTVSFAQNFHSELNLSALLQWYGVLSFIAFCYFLREGMVKYIIKVIFIYAVAYSMIYLIGAYLLSTGALDAYLDPHLVLTDPERMNRLFLAQFVTGFALFNSLIKLKERPNILYFIIATITFVAIVASLSRVFIIVVVLVSVIYILTSSNKIIAYVSLSLFAIISLYLIYGIVDPTFDPFTFSSIDQSTLQRNISFAIMRPYILNYPILGIGLPNNRDDLAHLLGPDSSPSDLGIIGIWVVFELVGVLLYIVSVFISCGMRFFDPSGVEVLSGDSLVLTGNCLGLYACISPNIWVGSGSLFFGIAIAARLNALLLQRRTPSLGRRRFRREPVM